MAYLPNGAIEKILIPIAQNRYRSGSQSLDYRDDLISRGYGFYSFYETTVAIAGKKYLEFVSPSDKYFALNFRQVITDQERLFYNVYVNYTGITPAASIRIGNLKSDSANASGSTYTETTGTPVLTNAIRVTHLPVFGSVNAGNRASGSLVGDSVFRLIAPNSTFLIELDNQSVDPIYVALELIWAEIPQEIIIEGGF